MKYIKKIRLAGASYNINRIVNNYIMLPITRIFSNIKYILTRELIDLDALDVVDDRVHYLEDKISTLLNDVDNIESTLEDKCDEYQVEDVIYNNIGSVDDLATYDDIEDINDKLNTIIDEDLKVIYDKLIRFDTIKDDVSISIENDDNAQRILDLVIERDLLINEVIKSIINRLESNENV